MSTPTEQGDTMTEFGWTRTADAIPTWDLEVDSSFYVEQWGLGSYAVYHGEQRIGEPGTYGTREEAQLAAEAEYKAGRDAADAEHELEGRVS